QKVNMENILKKAQTVGQEKHRNNVDKIIQYGTAGFRTRGEYLDHVIYRMGLLAALRSKVKRATIGVMITASHNPEEDNGVKLVDPLGEMLEASWEPIATSLANVKDADLGSKLEEIIKTVDIDISAPSKVFIGRDTRPSSLPLAQACIDGANVFSSIITDYGLLSTPQLHYMVRCNNTNNEYGQPNEQGYYKKLSTAFKLLRGDNPSNKQYKSVLHIDGANGVGALKVENLQSHLGDSITIKVTNDGSSGKLNHLCGADYVKVGQQCPENMIIEAGDRCASFDGDADRIVYFYGDKEGTFHLLDGDKIATLVAGYLKDLVSKCGCDLDLGLVQTAYANGSSTNYITEQLKVPVACAKTGVKHLHHRALDFDIGVYFEANGHGTVTFSDKAQNKIKTAKDDQTLSSEQREAAEKLKNVIDLINQTVGDAISDMLLVETILHTKGWDISEWNSAYKDLPNRQLKVKVKDRTVIETTDAERRTTSPSGLQEAIDAIVAKYNNGRSFVRPSGTEDVVRVYAESDTRQNADMLAHEVSVKVYELAGGVGDAPVAPEF
ncbi:unnamed protein product, partial [Owenia fusiformis]